MFPGDFYIFGGNFVAQKCKSILQMFCGLMLLKNLHNTVNRGVFTQRGEIKQNLKFKYLHKNHRNS
jgi:hypothetical protein